MKITLDITKSVQENAQEYFEKAKRAKKKLQGLQEARAATQQRLQEQKLKHEKTVQKIQTTAAPKRKSQWFEKFHWCVLSNNMLAIGGRDATTNEIIVKKHTLAHDVLFHTDMAGSPFVSVQTQGEELTDEIAEEAATLCGVYSRAWGRKYGSIEVFAAKPEQVTKEAQSGEYLPKGAFMVRGSVKYYHPRMELAIGVYQDAVMAGNIRSIKKHCSKYIVVVMGDKKISDLAKQIAKLLNYGDLDAIVRSLPTGGCDIDKKRSVL